MSDNQRRSRAIVACVVATYLEMRLLECRNVVELGKAKADIEVLAVQLQLGARVLPVQPSACTFHCCLGLVQAC